MRGREDKLWKVISRYIRLRDCLKTTGTLTHGKCYTCDEYKPFQLLDAGHFEPEGSCSYLKFDERNIHAQCKRCNGFLEGNRTEYVPRMIAEYGQDLVDEFRRIKLQTTKSWKKWELEELETEYKQKIKELESTYS